MTIPQKNSLSKIEASVFISIPVVAPMLQGFAERHCKPLKHNEDACNKLRHENGLAGRLSP
jgi:hypothetical protein